MEVIESRDPELLIDASDLLLKADALDCKREELQLKHQADDANQRIRLLALAQSVPVAELIEHASENGIFSKDATD